METVGMRSWREALARSSNAAATLGPVARAKACTSTAPPRTNNILYSEYVLCGAPDARREGPEVRASRERLEVLHLRRGDERPGVVDQVRGE